MHTHVGGGGLLRMEIPADANMTVCLGANANKNPKGTDEELPEEDNRWLKYYTDYIACRWKMDRQRRLLDYKINLRKDLSHYHKDFMRLHQKKIPEEEEFDQEKSPLFPIKKTPMSIEDKFQCNHCTKSYNHLTSLKRHMIMKHGIILDPRRKRKRADRIMETTVPLLKPTVVPDWSNLVFKPIETFGNWSQQEYIPTFGTDELGGIFPVKRSSSLTCLTPESIMTSLDGWADSSSVNVPSSSSRYSPISIPLSMNSSRCSPVSIPLSIMSSSGYSIAADDNWIVKDVWKAEEEEEKATVSSSTDTVLLEENKIPDMEIKKEF